MSKLHFLDKDTLEHLFFKLEKPIYKLIDNQLAEFDKRGLIKKIRQQGIFWNKVHRHNTQRYFGRQKRSQSDFPTIHGDLMVKHEHYDVYPNGRLNIGTSPNERQGKQKTQPTCLVWIDTNPEAPITYDVPLYMIIKPDSKKYRKKDTYHVYEHNPISKMEYRDSLTSPSMSIDVEDKIPYIGITKQGWQKRYKQHLSNARTGSPYDFHKKLRDLYAIQHSVLCAGLSYEEAMVAEEHFVDQYTLGKLLNHIPGGFKGFKYLKKFPKDLGTNEAEFKDELIGDIMREKVIPNNNKEGFENHLIKKHWENLDYYIKVVCSRKDRLSLKQIIKARILFCCDYSEENIKKQINASSITQVKNLLQGKTYRRII